MITNVIIAQPEILRLILRCMSRDLKAIRAVFVCRVAILYLNVSVPSPFCNRLSSLTTWASSRGQRPARPIALCFGNPCHFQAFDSNHNRSYNGRLRTRIRAEGQGYNENVKQYALRLACHNDNGNELKNIYKIRAEETIRQERECTYYCPRWIVGSSTAYACL